MHGSLGAGHEELLAQISSHALQTMASMHVRCQEAAGEAVALCRAALADAEFLNFRPSVLAAALLYAERRGRGALPFWPAALAQLSGYTHAATPELAAAIAAAQRCGPAREPSRRLQRGCYLTSHCLPRDGPVLPLRLRLNQLPPHARHHAGAGLCRFPHAVGVVGR